MKQSVLVELPQTYELGKAFCKGDSVKDPAKIQSEEDLYVYGWHMLSLQVVMSDIIFYFKK